MAANVVLIAKGAVDSVLVEQAVQALVRDELVALPTETVYGIAARIDRSVLISATRAPSAAAKVEVASISVWFRVNGSWFRLLVHCSW